LAKWAEEAASALPTGIVIRNITLATALKIVSIRFMGTDFTTTCHGCAQLCVSAAELKLNSGAHPAADRRVLASAWGHEKSTSVET